jgi:hypothetical protein
MYRLNTPEIFFLAPFLVQEVEAEYSVANGHSHNAEVIYGDTDSVMVRFGPTDLDKVMAIGMQYPLSIVPLTHDRFRQRGSGICNQEVREAHKTGVRKGLLPLFAHQQETLCWPVLDQTRKVRQDGL